MCRVVSLSVALVVILPAWVGAQAPTARSAPASVQVEVTGFSIDLQAGGTSRSLMVLRGKSTLGPVTNTGFAGKFGPPTYDPAAMPGWCEGTVLFFPLLQPAQIGLRFESTGDLLQAVGVVEADAGFCYDWTTNKYEGRGNATVVAGTGRFEGAEGDVVIRYTGTCGVQPCSLAPTVLYLSFTFEP